MWDFYAISVHNLKPGHYLLELHSYRVHPTSQLNQNLGHDEVKEKMVKTLVLGDTIFIVRLMDSLPLVFLF